MWQIQTFRADFSSTTRPLQDAPTSVIPVRHRSTSNLRGGPYGWVREEIRVFFLGPLKPSKMAIFHFTRSFCCQNVHGLDLSTCVQKKSFSKIWIVETTSFFYPTWKPTAHLSISLSVMIVPSDLLRLNLTSFWWKIRLKLVEPSLNTRGSSSGTPSTWRTI